MAITTLDGAIAGFKPPRFFHKGGSSTVVIGRPWSSWYVAGIPGGGAAPGAVMAGNILESQQLMDITNASPAVVSRHDGQPHNLVANDLVVFPAGSSPPSGFSTATNYFVIATGLTTTAFQLSATPGGAAINTTGAGTSVPMAALIDGQLPFFNPPSGSNTYLGRLTGAMGQGGQILLCDRLWHNGGIASSTSAQIIGSVTATASWSLGASTISVGTGLTTIFPNSNIYDTTSSAIIGSVASYNSGTGVITLNAPALSASSGAADVLSIMPQLPARDANGAAAGVGVLLGLEYNTTGAANTPTLTIKYTNSAGVAGRTGTSAFSMAASPPVGTFFPITLQAGDLGVQSVQSIQFSVAPTAGSCNLVAYRIIATLECPLSYGGQAIDLLTGGMPQIFDNTVPWLVGVPANTTSFNMIGSLVVAQG